MHKDALFRIANEKNINGPQDEAAQLSPFDSYLLVVCPLVVHLPLPAQICRVAHDVPIRGIDIANEQDPDIVLNCHQLGVVDSRLFGQLLSILSQIRSDGGESKFGLLVYKPRLRPALVDNAMLLWLDAMLPAGFAAICQDWPGSS